MDLLALDELMATLRDWLATCQAMVPRVCWVGGGVSWDYAGWE